MRARTTPGESTGSETRSAEGDGLEATQLFWGARAGRPLTQEDVRQIVENVGGFFRLLAQWDGARPEV